MRRGSFFFFWVDSYALVIVPSVYSWILDMVINIDNSRFYFEPHSNFITHCATVRNCSKEKCSLEMIDSNLKVLISIITKSQNLIVANSLFPFNEN